MPNKPTPKSKSKKAPKTVASSIAQMLKQPVDLESLVAEEMKRPIAGSSLKRDASVISVSSSDEETPLAMKANFKKVKIVLPRPGTPEYDNLKPVTLTCTPPTTPVSAMSSTGRPKRTITKTQKALAAETNVEDSPSPKKLFPKSSRKKLTQLSAAAPIDDSHVSVKVELPVHEDSIIVRDLRNVSPKKYPNHAKVAVSDDEDIPDALPSNQLALLRTPQQKSAKQKKPLIDDECEVSGDASDPSDAVSVGDVVSELESETREGISHDTKEPRQSEQLESGGTATKSGADAEESEDEDDSSLLAVTHLRWQDKTLRKYGLYDNLCEIPILYSFRPYDWSSRLFDEFATIENLSKSFDANVMRSLVAFLKFSRSGRFINMARSDPSLFTRGSPVKFAGKNTFPVSLMAVSVQESFIRSPGLYGNSTTIPVYKITGHPFPQEWRRDVLLWCSLLGYEDTEVAGPVGPLGVTFQTKTPSKTGTTTSSPVKPGKSKNTVHIPNMAPASRFSGTFNQTSHPFEVPIPIFDGRRTATHPAFSFSDADFDKLSSWPRWKAEGELPDDSLVVVGYTWTTYLSMNGSQSMSFSSNLLFVILLALAS
ncbi:hypothetical protein JOM56_002774 [Amanita muscaria]